MAYSYVAGEKKVRPGVYQRTSNRGAGNTAGAVNGIVAFVMAANWGPTTVTTHETAKSIRETYGSGTGVEAACKILEAGASTVYIKRLTGEGGAAGTATIGDAITLTAKYVGSRALKVTVKEKAGDATMKQALVLEGTTLLETLEFAVHETDETDAFLAAVANSAYVTATKNAAGLIAAGDYELKGTDATVTAANYADAYYALEPYNYNVMAVDSISADVRATVCAYALESYDNGKMSMFVVGDTPKTTLTERMKAATACNSARVVFFGSSWVDSTGKTVEGVQAVAYVAGVIAATPANQSIVHAAIAGATDTAEKLTNAQYSEAIQKGLLLVSVGPDGQVWFDSGVNTLVTLGADQDEGWKKIRRVKTRYELMDRIDRTLAPKVGKVNCDTDGIAYIIQCASGVIKEMIAEKKLSAGSFYEDPENPHAGDSAWFIIEVDDIDSLEKIYLHYQYSYSAN